MMPSDHRQRRNALSCEGCRHRKVKCVKPPSGPCHRCHRLGKECQLGGPTSRPDYHTSKERYELLVSVVRHFVPSASFSTEGLRQVVQNLPSPVESSLPSAIHTSTGIAGPWLEDALAVGGTPPAPLTPRSPLTCAVDDLEDTLVADAMNMPRLNGSSSCTALNVKLVSHLSQSSDGLSPFQNNESPQAFDGHVIPNRIAEYLPDRMALEQAAVGFFTNINSVIYILDQERFHFWLDDVYSGKQVCTSVLVILYLVMALCGDNSPSFDIARSYMDDVVEESSLDSVRAIMLMTLNRQSQNACSAGWVMLGVAIRIAQSFGLHQSIGYRQDTSVYRAEIKKRLWWSLCELDQWTSSMLGRPPGTCHTGYGISLPSQELNTTSFTPPGYATASAALGCLIGQISERLYLDKKNTSGEEQLRGELIQKVEQWRHNLPLHLSPESAIVPSFARATFYLGLKYNYVRMLIGRPYMTHSIICNNAHDAVFNSRVEICEQANRDSVNILHKLHKQGLLATSLWFDTYFVISTALILFMRAIKKPSMQEDLQLFLPILKLCNKSKVGQYAAENFERFLRNLDPTTEEIHMANVADFLPQSSNMGQYRSLSGDSLLHEINFNHLEENNEFPLAYFDFGQDFNLQLCGAGGPLNEQACDGYPDVLTYLM